MKTKHPLFANKGVFSWCLYDWGNAAFPAIILTFVFAAYFSGKVALNKITGTVQWADTVAIAGIIVALISPILGATADQEGRRKPWVMIFVFLMMLSTGMLWFVKPNTDYIRWASCWVALGIIGEEGAQVFYNAMLRDLVPKSYTGRISGLGWGIGYIGGLCSLFVALFIFVRHGAQWLNLNADMYEHIRICGPFVSVWILLFTLPFFIFTPDRPRTGLGYWRALRQGLQQLKTTINSVRKYREIMKFLVARMIYLDGLNTLFAFGGIYAAGTFNMDFNQLLEFGISLNAIGVFGAVGLGWVDDYLGSKPTILLSLMGIMGGGIFALFAHSLLTFWLLVLFMAFFVGPVQAASRSLLVHIAPAEMVAEMFGLFTVSGRLTAFVGPWLLGAFTLLFNSQRVGMSTLFVFFIVGAILLATVKVEKTY